MEPEIRTLVDISDSPAALKGRVDLVLERARWASFEFQRLDRDAVMRIVDAVAEVAHEKAAKYAEWAVEEAGFGVAAHKRLKNEMTARPLVDFYRNEDFVNPRIDEARKIVEIPRPAGVIFALTPSTNPIATVNFKTILAMLTRNAIVMSPHPAVRECSVDAVHAMTRAAVDAGAPEGVIQVVEDPNIPLIEAFMGSDKTDVILATGGTAMVRTAYSSSNPAIGVGPGNAPVFVDASADIKLAAQRIVDSKCFDNSILCTNESTLITLEEVDQNLRRSLQNAGAYICDEDETKLLRNYLYHERGFNVAALGQDAMWIANQVGMNVPSKTRILVTPITQIGIEEPLSKEKLCPVLSYYVAKSVDQAIAQARAVLRLTGAGHSAAIHTQDERVAMAYASTVESYRVVVNAPCSQGASGFETNLAPSFTIGTGYFGRSSVGENIRPDHLVHWTRLAYNSDPLEQMGNYHGLSHQLDGPLPKAPADGVPGETRQSNSFRGVTSPGDGSRGGIDQGVRDELRQLIAEELRNVLKK